MPNSGLNHIPESTDIHDEKSLSDTLEKYFWYATFKPGQLEVINRIVSGQSAAAIFPTGSGKSLCYQLPALHLPHLTLVVSPLLALMQDQLLFLSAKGIAAARIDSSLSRDEEREVMEKVRSGYYKILLIAVERFKNERFRKFLSGVPISLMVIDEAHCISEWGHNFRPDYLKLPVYQREFNVAQVLLLTATATPAVITDMCAKFNLRRDAVIVTGFYRSNLRLWVKPVTNDKDSVLYELLKDAQPAIVYVTLQKTAETVAEFLNGKGVNAIGYHAGMKHEDRERIQDSFMSGQVNCIVATIAFGMGIDKRDIRRVIHYNLPKNLESYGQEIGRAGRDGRDSDCIVLANLDDVPVLKNFVYSDTPEEDSIKRVLQDIKDGGTNWDCVLCRLAKRSSIRVLPLKTMLVYLEQKGIIKPLYSYFSDYQYKNVINDDKIANKYSGVQRDDMDKLFAGVLKKKKWSVVDFKAIKLERIKVVEYLDQFAENGWIKPEASLITEMYEVINPGFDIDEAAGYLTDLFQQKEQSEIARIDRMVEFFGGTSCLNNVLATHFGQELDWEKCNHCSACAEGGADITSSASLKPLSDYNFNELVYQFLGRLSESASSELTAKFLCGINTKRLTDVEEESYYGILEKYPYPEVRKWVDQKIKEGGQCLQK